MADELTDGWLSRDPLPEDPVPIVKQWLDEAFAARVQPNPHAVALATVDPDGSPSARMVLCNAIDVRRGAFVMYTNRESRKGRALDAHPRAAIVFYFIHAGRQVRVEGNVERTPDDACDAYFATRPVDAQVGAWASRQSEPIASREELVTRVEREAERFGVRLGDQHEEGIPRPSHWGGFTLVADVIELWVSRPARIHDRVVWTRPAGAAGAGGSWQSQRLQP